MSATFLDPVFITCTTSLQTMFTAPASGKVHKVDVRAANVGAAAATVDLVLTNGTITINRCKNFAVGYGDTTAAPDLENGLIVPAGFYLRCKASASTTVEVSVVNRIESDTADFT